MALKMRIVKDQRENLNTIVFGSPMAGKTFYTVATLGRDETLYISTDGNALPGCKVIEVSNWYELIEAIDYALERNDFKAIVLDVLDDAVSFAEAQAQKMLGMDGKADAKGGYGKFTNTVCELVKEMVLRPLVMSDRKVWVLMHSEIDKNGNVVPAFGSFHRDAIEILNWLKGRSDKVVRCWRSGNKYFQTVEDERNLEASKHIGAKAPAAVEIESKEN